MLCALLAWAGACAARGALPEPVRWPLTTQDVVLVADSVQAWEDDRLPIRWLLLRGDVTVEQGARRLHADEMLAWLPSDAKDDPSQRSVTPVAVVSFGAVTEQEARREPVVHGGFSGVLRTTGLMRLRFKGSRPGNGSDHPLVAAVRGDRRLDGMAGPDAPSDPQVRQAQFQGTPNFGNLGADGRPPLFGGDPTLNRIEQQRQADAAAGGPIPGGIGPGISAPGTGGTTRRIRGAPRSSQGIDVDSFRTATGEQVTAVTGGVNLIVEELETGNVVRMVADRAVIWTTADVFGSIQGGEGMTGSGQDRWQVYLEGNVFIRRGNVRNPLAAESVILAGKQIFFDVNTEQALILQGEVETFSQEFQAPLIMTADVLRQLTPQRWVGENASFTTSPYRGRPGYDVLSGELVMEQTREIIENPFTGRPVIDEATGQPRVRTRHFATGRRNVLRVEGTPVFFLPYIRADVEDPLGPLENVRIGATDNLGFTTEATFDVWQLLGLDYTELAQQSQWLTDIGYHSDRGPSLGSRANYSGRDFLGKGDEYFGRSIAWGIHDEGVDTLGVTADRIVTPPRETRGRLRYQHRHDWNDGVGDGYADGYTVIAELSYLSDEFLLESFFENEYDIGKDQDTVLYLKRQRGTEVNSVLVQKRINPFLPQNDWLPRLDSHSVGRSLFGDRVTYFRRDSIAYAGLRPPEQLLLAGERDVDTARLHSRQEFDLPVTAGPVRLVPYAVGQFDGYTETEEVEGLGRAYGEVGLRARLPFWKLYPTAESRLFNVNGLAHKVTLAADYRLGRSTQDLDALPPLEQVDDDTTELIRRRNFVDRFGRFGRPVPLAQDPYFFANRQGVWWIPETITSLHRIRAGVNQRLETKRGPLGQQRLVEWLALDLSASYFPDQERDNFDEPFGLLEGDFRWAVGDRTAVFATLLHDPFDDRIAVNSSVLLQRPPRTMLSLFHSHVSNPDFTINYVGGSSSYRFSDKYAGFVATGVDVSSDMLDPSYEIGISRVGLDFIVNLAIVFNAGRDDFGAQFEILPRIRPRGRIDTKLQRTLPFGVTPAGNEVVRIDPVVPITNSFSYR